MITDLLAISLLGFKHALDPDHLAATLDMVTIDKASTFDAAKLGYSWGLGHAATVSLLGLPVILFSAKLPEWAYSGAEFLVGFIIVLLAIQLAFQWITGKFHLHKPRKTKHFHRRAFSMGMVHGFGGSIGAALLVLAAVNSTWLAALALVVFCGFSILSMTLVTGAFGYMVLHHKATHFVDRFVIPMIIAVTLGFGVTYMHNAWPF